MKLSVVIPTMNEAKELPNLMDAISRQTFRDFEVIVADKFSKDGTREIAEAAGARVVDGGLVAEGRNNGAAVARGELILFLDADVAPKPDCFEKAVREFEARGLGTASAEFVPMSERFSDKLLHKLVWWYFLLTQSFWPHAPGFFILTRRDIFEKTGGFDPEIKLAEDHAYVNVAKKFGKFRQLRTTRIPVSARRLRKEGLWGITWKYVVAEFYLIFKGPIKSDVFDYQFGHDDKDKK